MEEALVFENKKGRRLFAIAHVPDGPPMTNERIGVNLLNPGIKYRVAPNRLSVKIARRLCSDGYFVLRFDPEGIGDSEGASLANELLPDVFEKVQSGAFVSDATDANRFFMERYGISKLIMAGNCGGAITAILTSRQDPRVDGLILIDVPIQLRHSDQTFADKVVAGGKTADRLFAQYLRKAGDREAWHRFFTFKSNYAALYKIVGMKLSRIVLGTGKTKKAQENLDSFCKENGLNPYFFEAFTSFAKNGKPILFVMAGNDKYTEFFHEFFENQFLSLNEPLTKDTERYQIDMANHVYTLYEWQSALIEKISEWMNATTGCLSS